MTIQFAGRALASGQFVGRALTGVYKGSTKLWPAAAPGGPTIVDIQTAYTTGSAAVGTPNAVTFADVQAGDTIVALTGSTNVNSETFTASDSSDNTYATAGNYSASGSVLTVNCAYAVAAANAASLTVNVYHAHSNYASTTFYLLRGKTFALDSANVVSGALNTNSTGLYPTAAFATSGPAFVVAAWANNQGSGFGLDFTITTPTGWTQDSKLKPTNASTSVGVAQLHGMFDTAVSGQTLGFTPANAAPNAHPAYLIVPFTYT